ncbi:MAG: glycosyltransferase family 4 protein [Oscillatoriaceae bacterium SKW80]|nr:glycosyltransferase family 4 protein [Oscillatoriaceae bacterium SKW80]
MKILLLSTYDILGGAARAAYRLHKGLQMINVDSRMLVQLKFSYDPTVIGPVKEIQKELSRVRPILDDLLLKKIYHYDIKNKFSVNRLPENILSKVSEQNPDVVNIHWVSDGYLKIETISKFRKPVVLTLHDMWAFTGGCHYSMDCDRYKNSCGKCPQLGSNKDLDLSYRVWQRKAKSWKNKNLTIISPSQWLANCARESSLFRNSPIEVIPNGLDTDVYKPINRQFARERLNFPRNKKIILFGAQDPNEPRKGFNLLKETLQHLKAIANGEDIALAILGSSQPSCPPDLGFSTYYLGKLSDDISLSLVYGAADVFIAPSVQDNLPNTVMEALACGTPCVAFNIGGMPELIEHKKNGYLSPPFDVKDLAQGIYWLLSDLEIWHKLCERAREKVTTEFTLEKQAKSYVKIFQQIANIR